jgi:hydroxymethylpyrimidine pyrophosphatase-like HAD family hydrolase
VRQVASEAGCEVCRSDRHFLEILPAGCGKGTAARWVFAQLGWPALASVAVGDNENDAHLFALCGLAAAVANAAPRTQATADLRLPACADAGVAALVDILLSSGVRGAVAEVSAGAD